ncbi:MAG: Manganese/iron superoxide dismutase [Bacteroidetes bacterium]|nr:MAG: Manganese/iron superoxide dismutase [Bacteroidota bacterium]
MNVRKITFLFTLTLFLSLSLMAQDKVKTEFNFAPLPYAYDALEQSIDKQTMEIHYDRHHRAYYTNFVKAIAGTEMEYMTMEQILASISKFPISVRNNGGGHYNHDLFWSILSPAGGNLDGSLAEAIVKKFGSVDDFKKQFEQAGATRFGSGWAWLSVDDKGELFISSTANQDNPLMDVVTEKGTPILGLDVWEHAYYLRYQNKRASYMTAFWNVVNWKEVSNRYEAAVK